MPASRGHCDVRAAAAQLIVRFCTAELRTNTDASRVSAQFDIYTSSVSRKLRKLLYKFCHIK